MNLIFDKIFYYKLSYKISIIVSIIFSIIFIISKRTILSMLLFIFLLWNINEEIKQQDYRFNKFLLERYLYDYNFKVIKVNKITSFKKYKKHIIKNTFERDFLRELFDI